MLFKERKNWNSVVASWCVKVGRNYKKHRSRKMPILFRRRGYTTHTTGIIRN
jgi:hypothetical protein